MAWGPGVYDKEATRVRERTQASGVLLIVLDGKRGTGFSAQTSPLDLFRLPAILREVAAQIERSGPGA